MVSATSLAVLLLAGLAAADVAGRPGIPNRPDLPEWIPNIPEWLENIPEWIANLPNLIDNLPDLQEILPDLIDKLPDWIGAVPDWIDKLPEWIDNLPDWIDKLPEWIDKLPEWIDKLPDWLQTPERPGTPARIEDYPSNAQIECGVGPLWVQTCVGTILTSRHVLTVAHCFFIPRVSPRVSRIRAGSTQRGVGGQVIQIDYVINHPEYNVKSLDNDISIIRLRSPLAFGATVQQATIAATGLVFPPNVPVTIASWGRTTQDGLWADRNLYNVALYTVQQSSCVNKYASLPVPIQVTDNMFCSTLYGYDGAIIGVRDGGAPLFYDNILVGLVAFGTPVGDIVPLIATAVSPYANWIVENAVY